MVRGELTAATAYRHGVRVRSLDGRWRAAPLEVRVQDNGPGVPERMREHLFEPSSRPSRTGRGWASRSSRGWSPPTAG
jgi:two-component system nitrogen regulation sensor histidine kinase GlnL